MPSNEDWKLLISASETDGVQTKVVGDYEISYFVAKDPDKDKDNEDSLFISYSAGQLLMGVCDGAGGHPRGADASKIVCETFVKQHHKNKEHFDLAQVIEEANQNVIDLKAGAKSTMILAWVTDGKFRSASVGDSEVVYWNSQAREIYSNIPHSVVGYKIEAGILDQEKALDEDDRYAVDHLMGDEFIRIEMSSGMALKKGHCLVLGSDGIFDNFSHNQLSSIFSEGKLTEFAELCKSQPKDNWKKRDDVAFIFLKKLQ